MVKINLGCGGRKLPGYINIDYSSDVNPDIVCHIGHDKLPFKDNSVDYAYSNHFFEHMNTNETKFLLDELYRVCRNGAIIEVICPHQMSPVASHIEHKQSISECFFDAYRAGKDEADGESKEYFKIDYSLSFMRYRPKRTGVLRFLPFLSIVPCNVHFKLEVVKKIREDKQETTIK